MPTDIVRELRGYSDRELMLLQLFLKLIEASAPISSRVYRGGQHRLDALETLGLDVTSAHGVSNLVAALEVRLEISRFN